MQHGTCAIKVAMPKSRAALTRDAVALDILQAAGGHPNIVELTAVVCRSRTIASATSVSALATPAYPGGDLEQFLLHNTVPEALQARIAQQVASALAHAHSRNIAHCDLKSANVLLTAERDTKVADWGGSQALGRRRGVMGSLISRSPEVHRSGTCGPAEGAAALAYDTAAADCWSFGVLLLELKVTRLFHQAIYHATELAHGEFAAALAAGRRPAVFDELLDAVRGTAAIPLWADIVARALEPDPARRAPLAQLRALVDVAAAADALLAAQAALPAAGCGNVPPLLRAAARRDDPNELAAEELCMAEGQCGMFKTGCCPCELGSSVDELQPRRLHDFSQLTGAPLVRRIPLPSSLLPSLIVLPCLNLFLACEFLTVSGIHPAATSDRPLPGRPVCTPRSSPWIVIVALLEIR